MSNAIRLSAPEPEPPRIQYGCPPKVSPTYPILLALVAVIGLASLVAWYWSEFSLEERSQRGEARAQYLLGKRYFDHAVRPQDYVLAAKLIRQAAEQGYARAQTGLGLLYENGIGVPLSYPQAIKWFQRAADQGYSVAQNELGVMYAKGRGVPRNLDEAAKWCGLAAAQGSDIARKNLELTQLASRKVISEINTPDKQSYKQAVVQRVEPDGVTVSFVPDNGGFGMAKLKLENLPSELKRLCRNTTKEGAAADSAYSHIGAIATPL
jgi:hypothetical protein